MPAPSTVRPALSADEAAAIAASAFGVRGRAEALPGELDGNFRIHGEEGIAGVLKVSHAGEDAGVLDLQVAALERLAEREPDLPVPRVLPAAGGGRVVTVTDASGAPHLARMVSHLPGKSLAATRPHSPRLLRGIGEALARFDRGLFDFEHAAMDRALKWDLRRAEEVVPELVPLIEGAEHRRLVETHLARFAHDSAPSFAALRSSVVHGDANDENVLVTSRLDGQEVTGLIDLGDVVKTATVADLAIACAYVMLAKADPLASAAHVVGGYHAAFPLEEREVEVLFDLIALRLCVSVGHSAKNRQVDPDNAHLFQTEADAFPLLARLAAIPPAFARAVFRDACGWEPSPRGRALATWLASGVARPAPVFAADEPPRVLPLGADGVELAAAGDPGDRAAFAAAVERLRGGRIGVGRYGEARLFHREPAFREPTEDGGEWRTVAAGVDLFAAAGTEVRAPLEGVVHALREGEVVLRHASGDGEFFASYRGVAARELAPGSRVGRGEPFAALLPPERNGGWPPHVHVQVAADELAERLPAVVRPSQRRIWESVCPDPGPLLGLDAATSRAADIDTETLRAARASHVGPSLSVAYERPLAIVRGWMQTLFDADGQPYLDGVNNVCHVGHCHPAVVRAGQAQMAALNTNTRYLHPNLNAYAARLAATLPAPLEVCYLVCSGSEANELALRLARAYTGGTDVVVLEAGYHGNTQGLIDVSSYKFDGPGGSGAPAHVHTVPLPDGYRGPIRGFDEAAGRAYAEQVVPVLDAIERDGKRVAAFLAESMPGCGGQIVLPEGYLRAAYELVRARGGVCIADEVQTGFGRCGERFWAFETQGVVPDVVTLGKPIGNGHPLAAVVTTRAIAAAFDNGMEYFNTFGGNPVACAIGSAVLDVIEGEKLREHARAVGELLLERLGELKERHPLVGDVRGRGLFLGVELVRDRETREPAAEEAAYVDSRLRDAGILLSTDGPDHNVLKLKPPLPFDARDAARLVEALDRVLGETCLSSGRR